VQLGDRSAHAGKTGETQDARWWGLGGMAGRPGAGWGRLSWIGRWPAASGSVGRRPGEAESDQAAISGVEASRAQAAARGGGVGRDLSHVVAVLGRISGLTVATII
jgi:hypothetical protein